MIDHLAIADRRANEGGFTIIELLISVTVLAMVLGLLSGALFALSKNWNSATKTIDSLDMMARAFDILNRDASGLQRLVSVDGGSPKYIFSGTATGMSFVALEPAFPTEPGPYYLEYAVVQNGEGMQLVRSRAPYQSGMRVFPGATPANRVPLLEGSYRYEFAYASKTTQTPAWHASWPWADRLPDLIRLQAVDAGSGVSLSPPMIVAVRADAELGCIGEQNLCSPITNGVLDAQTGNRLNPP